MTETMTPRMARMQEAIETIRSQNGGVCMAIYHAASKDPQAKAIIDQVERDMLKDVAATRTPGIGSFTMTRKVAARAYDKLQSGDTLGAAGDYAAVVAIGATSWIPFGGDATISLLRAGGVDLDRAPVHNAYNTVTGAALFCRVADVKAREKINGSLSGEDMKVLMNGQASEGQMAALEKIRDRIIAAAVEKAGEAPQPETTGQLPSPTTPRVSQAPAHEGRGAR